MLTVLTVANQFDRYMPWMLESCRRQGIRMVTLGMGNSHWAGLSTKLHETYRYLKESARPGEPVLFADAFDSVIVRSGVEILEVYRSFGHPLVVSAEKNCAPHAEKADRYPPGETAWRFVNSGGWIGDPEYVLSVLEEMDVMNIPPRVNDQAVFTDFYLANPSRFALDFHCRLFQTLFWSRNDLEKTDLGIRNRITGTYPAVIHANGWWQCLEPILQWSDLTPGAVVRNGG